MVQRSSTITVFCDAHLRLNRFQLHVPPPQRLTVTAPTSKAMAGTRRRTTAGRSTISQAPHSTIQILQSRTVLILEPVNLEGSNVILDTATGVRAQPLWMQRHCLYLFRRRRTFLILLRLLKLHRLLRRMKSLRTWEICSASRSTCSSA